MIQKTIQTLDLRGIQPTRAELLHLIPRPVVDIAVASQAAEKLIAEVRAEGETALKRHAAAFDRVSDVEVRVDPAEITAAVATLDPDVRAALEASIERVRTASEAQLHAPVATTLGPGAHVHQRWVPVGRVGLYVPGGKAALSSSVVMNVVPAQVAGVQSIALVSPAQSEFGGRVHPTILGAAGLLGIDEVYVMGGASAIGALAYGVTSLGLEPVDVVTGPGNIYVAAAKRLVRGVVGIDSEAGTTEILVIADETANPRYVAADLISQAEHDEAAAALLVTDSAELAERVVQELDVLAAATPNSARVIEALGGQQSAIVLVDDLGAAARFSNVYAPEHLEIQTANNTAVLATITSAGAIFVGAHSPVSLGDYLAGSNHVLPTGGQARFSSGLGAYTFLRPQQVIDYDRAALEQVAAEVVALSGAEAMPAHGAAVTVRFS
ncbi:histidinol dehydrogenase [Mycetocola zhadangensis]|uniref:Histidinol dehydrogenase n=1 Tax=Mycetocola zhadangensis TaxID=1164595 RepID=A0A3L7J777_9MICO|nr:histidinol dehydrogenase [Mycetocola zhadangensis]RLQ86274.1 histidinol dehydrogenase [Mycetocola zhadangensis]GGE89796.1 histidinol dehydrogenase [Mycetocola zhadangensis]